ncbi:MAG: hypothetical protein DI539_24775 [Flavobacterium psychrophilum]|nr:MAG: hypothetical protein DI539_24775 [Flavobacterium psychrophilum]
MNVNNMKIEDRESWFVLGNGLEMTSKKITFSPNLFLQQIENEISVFDLAAAGAKGFREWTMLEPVSRFCRLEIVSVNETPTLGYDSLNRAWLLGTLLVLRMYLRSNFIACSSYSWNKIAGVQKRKTDEKSSLEPFKGNLLDYHRKTIHLKDISKKMIEESDVEWINKYYENANLLAAQNANFRFSLETINSWRYSNDNRSAVAIIWAAIESIIGVSSEIVFRLSLNVASVLESRGHGRLEKFKHIKKLYGLRSKIVHGGDLKKEDAEFAIEESFILLRDLLTFMIERNKVISEEDFEAAVFL